MPAKPITIAECDRQINAYRLNLLSPGIDQELTWVSIDYWLDERLELMRLEQQKQQKRKRVPVGE